MVTAAIIQLQASHQTDLPVSHGLLANAAALALFARYDPALARQLHDQNGGKPFTVSMLVTRHPGDGKTIRLAAGARCQWRITGLNQEVGDCLRQVRLGEQVRIGASVWQIEQVKLESRTYGDIAAQWLTMAEDKLPPVVTLQVISPAAFKRGRYEYPFPAPEVLWPSLLKRWNMWSDALCHQLPLALAEDVFLHNWQGETRRLAMGKRWAVGCTGRFSYAVAAGQTEVLRLLHLLADFACYAGIGWQTTCGMGQVRRQR